LRARQINEAQGEAQAILLKAQATADSLERISKVIGESKASGQDAMSLQVATKYIEAFGGIARTGNTVVIPSNVADVAGMVTGMMGVFQGMQASRRAPPSSPDSA
jgi:regulator of protease activity HflC (stomatin/prohibitin superfamily)